VSPQNVLIGVDGDARILDFGVAKASIRLQTTRTGQVKGKISYMPPEQLRGRTVTRRTDVYSAAVVLWETLTCQRLFASDDDGVLLEQIMLGVVDPPSRHAPAVPPALDDVVLTGLASAPEDRFESAKAMADALEAAVAPALASEVAAWVESLAGPELARRAHELAEVERDDTGSPVAVAVTETTPSASRKTPRSALAGAAAMLVVVTALATTAAVRGARPEAAHAATAASASSEDAPRAAPPAVASASAPPLAAVEAAVAAPSAPASALPAPPAPPPREPPRARAAAPENDCAIPYTIAGDGRRVYKRKCLR
jgi:serine/threonine-protein kinase